MSVPERVDSIIGLHRAIIRVSVRIRTVLESPGIVVKLSKAPESPANAYQVILLLKKFVCREEKCYYH